MASIINENFSGTAASSSAAAASTLTGTTLASNVVASSLTSLGTLSNVDTATLSASGQITSTVSTGTAPLVIASTTQVANLSVATAGVANTVSSASEATDTTCFPLFITASGTQSLQPKNNANFTFNSNTAALGSATLTTTGIITAAGDITLTASTSGSTRTVTSQNTSNTASSDARFLASVGGSSGGDPHIVYDVSGVGGYTFGIDNSDSDALKIDRGAPATVGGNTLWKMSTAGELTMSAQPAFLAYRSASVANVTGAGTVYTVAFDTEVFDQNADYNNGTFTFTAPVTGRYMFSCGVGVTGLTVLMTQGTIDIVTSNRTYRSEEASYGVIQNASNAVSLSYSVLVDMDAADTATVQLTVSNGAGNTADLDGGAAPARTFFSGYLAC